MNVNVGIPRSVFKRVLTELRLIREALQRAYPEPPPPVEIPPLKPGVRYDPRIDAIEERKGKLHEKAISDAVDKK